MRFINENHNLKKLNDNVFYVSSMAKKAKAELGNVAVINSTIGSFVNEEGEIVAFKTVYDQFNEIPNPKKAAYASGMKGNPEFIEAISDFVLEKRIHKPYTAIASAGGTAAISMAIKNCTNPNDTLLIPEVAWASYSLMAEEYNLNLLKYDVYAIDDLLSKVQEVANKEGRVFLIINNPCHNPCGATYSKEQWRELVDGLNQIEVPIVLLNDIAYIDYSYDLAESRAYLDIMNDLNDHILYLIAYSCSKAFTGYGQRLGVLFIIHEEKELISKLENIFEKSARVTFSNVNNGFMQCITAVLNEHKEAYLKEKDDYIQLLKKRSDLFIQEADAINLNYYPYKEGFFVTLPLEDKKRDDLHQKLIDHHIYTVKVSKGIRIALCSTPLFQIKPLVQMLKNLLDGQDGLKV